MNPAVSLFEQPKIDCHCHVFDPQAFPYADDVAYRPAGAELGTARYFGQVLDAYGVRHALLVQPNSGYGSDNRCMLEAIADGQGRFKGVAIVAADASDADLQDLKRRGVVAVAHNLAMLGESAYAGHDAFWRRLAAAGLFVQVQVCDDQMLRLAPRLRACGATIVVDHHGRPDVQQGPGGAAFRALLGLAAGGSCYVKLSGHDKFSRQPVPFEDTRPFTQALLEHFGPARCLWGSDWPHLRARQRLDYGPLLALFAQGVPDPEDRNAVWYETPRRLFGFAQA